MTLGGLLGLAGQIQQLHLGRGLSTTVWGPGLPAPPG